MKKIGKVGRIEIEADLHNWGISFYVGKTIIGLQMLCFIFYFGR